MHDKSGNCSKFDTGEERWNNTKSVMDQEEDGEIYKTSHICLCNLEEVSSNQCLLNTHDAPEIYQTS